ncbi:hypothetical protein HDA39_001190 [Kribbella italica]|uniref:Uncharacterized protein n=1 Tax=Kribbella italica TaxID=1540520 RepID=A0A7W9J2K1_9ACTN|nr:hypothetical protein [Kribbella italica]
MTIEPCSVAAFVGCSAVGVQLCPEVVLWIARSACRTRGLDRRMRTGAADRCRGPSPQTGVAHWSRALESRTGVADRCHGLPSRTGAADWRRGPVPRTEPADRRRALDSRTGVAERVPRTETADRCRGPVPWTGVADRCRGPAWWTGAVDRRGGPTWRTGAADRRVGPVPRTGAGERHRQFDQGLGGAVDWGSVVARRYDAPFGAGVADRYCRPRPPTTSAVSGERWGGGGALMLGANGMRVPAGAVDGTGQIASPATTATSWAGRPCGVTDCVVTGVGGGPWQQFGARPMGRSCPHSVGLGRDGGAVLARGAADWGDGIRGVLYVAVAAVGGE